MQNLSVFFPLNAGWTKDPLSSRIMRQASSVPTPHTSERFYTKLRAETRILFWRNWRVDFTWHVRDSIVSWKKKKHKVLLCMGNEDPQVCEFPNQSLVWVSLYFSLYRIFIPYPFWYITCYITILVLRNDITWCAAAIIVTWLAAHLDPGDVGVHSDRILGLEVFLVMPPVLLGWDAGYPPVCAVNTWLLLKPRVGFLAPMSNGAQDPGDARLRVCLSDGSNIDSRVPCPCVFYNLFKDTTLDRHLQGFQNRVFFYIFPPKYKNTGCFEMLFNHKHSRACLCVFVCACT